MDSITRETSLAKGKAPVEPPFKWRKGSPSMKGLTLLQCCLEHKAPRRIQTTPSLGPPDDDKCFYKLNCFPPAGFPLPITSTEPGWDSCWDPLAAAASCLHCSQHLHLNCFLLPAAELKQAHRPLCRAQGPFIPPSLLHWEDAAPDSPQLGCPCPISKAASQNCQQDQSAAQSQEMHLSRAQSNSSSQQNSNSGTGEVVPRRSC